MKSATRRKGKPLETFEEQYRSRLLEYAAGGGEQALGQAYELGRRALTEKKSLVEMAALHHQAVIDLARSSENEKQREELLRASSQFLGECLSPYEMAHRGFQDAVNALRHLNETLEEEIKRIAYAVHDEAGQLLVAVHLALAEVATELPEPQQAQFTRIKEMLTEVEKHLRRYSHELRPTILDDLGWVPAIRFLADGVSKRSNIPIHIDATFSERLPTAIETTLYRIVQEALTNAVKHSQASNLWIRAWKENLVLCCSIRDDGVGFDIALCQRASLRKGLGLIAMRERVSAIGGTLQMESRPGHGTELSLRLPLEVNHANSNRTRR
ncbi:MAG TPA: ATP-binding protein [Candidatus Cybelea sp.]|nr:ATP-binding protein [Candidatus Cybelea sp.]